jgi:hypothetical protein
LAGILQRTILENKYVIAKYTSEPNDQKTYKVATDDLCMDENFPGKHGFSRVGVPHSN